MLIQRFYIRFLILIVYRFTEWRCGTGFTVKYYRKISVSYHASLKKILKVPRFYSNHFVSSILNVFTFENLLNFRQLRFLFWLRKCQSPCFYLHKTYFLYNSTFAHIYRALLKYDRKNILFVIFTKIMYTR